jgi:hypothetical protein
MIDGTDRERPEPSGEFVSVEGEKYYRISSFDRMQPFLMSIVSDTDLWMYVSSAGGLTAGRVNEDGALFPYETVDKLHSGHHATGPATIMKVKRKGRRAEIWRPLHGAPCNESRVERNLYKNVIGNRLIFEEIDHDTELEFRYRWSMCEEYGCVRTSWLTNRGTADIAVSVLDGLRNVLPYGAPLALHQGASSLIDAYKRADIDPDTKIGVFSLTSAIVDRPQAAEELRANTVWFHGLEDATVCLSIGAVETFRCGGNIKAEEVLTGQKGNYFVAASFSLPPGAGKTWFLAGDAGKSHVQIAELRERILQGENLDRLVEESLRDASANLFRIVGSSDGIQLTGHTEAGVHHFANVLFNNMRGGVFSSNYRLPSADLMGFLNTRDRPVADRHRSLLESLPREVPVAELLSAAEKSQDTDLIRLCHEYMPIYFSRRHGDPSRPWNRFNIRTKNSDGTRALRYEGNWRDIFQNWEALCLSFPGFLPSVIAKFVNASTVDGFNAYRITRDGIDWEVVDKDDPWSHIGYWGDHQIVYLLKFLEALKRICPGALERMLELDIFCYAEVPYRLRPYEAILADPHSTIDYDFALASRIEERVKETGTDGRLVHSQDGAVYHVNLIEKLLVPALSKLSNMVPDGGIWMNTQRPEWNDANNALVGKGLSMVTLCYLRRYLRFIGLLLDELQDTTATISNEIARWFEELKSIFLDNRSLLALEKLEDRDRKLLLDAAGKAFARYRNSVYSKGFSGKSQLSVSSIADFCRAAIEYIDHAVRANRRDDGMYHSYNLLEISEGGSALRLRRLNEMLEGQVAVLSSGVIDAGESLQLIESLFESRLYRKDQRSFVLYPEEELPRFMDRNRIPDEEVAATPLLQELLAEGDVSVLQRGASGVARFNADFRNAADLRAALDRLEKDTKWKNRVAKDREAVLKSFEEVFHHSSFTGRSGTMYGYEGLGCIYWHMVSKLLLAVQEAHFRARRNGDSEAVVDGLARAYYRVRAGLGFEKTVNEYGAFPTDPYSHTPRHAGAQQPGMTGQVKEEIITRFGELGVEVEGGTVGFNPVLLRPVEFLKKCADYRYCDIEGSFCSVNVPEGSLAFTVCQVPVIYELCDGDAWIRVIRGDGRESTHAGNVLDKKTSADLFNRTGALARVHVGVPRNKLLVL